MLVLPPVRDLPAVNPDPNGPVVLVMSTVGVLSGTKLLLLVEDDGVKYAVLVHGLTAFEEGTEGGGAGK